jgi:7-cyano-7-deazaguanine synthase in queuosine biosynthesis
MLSQMKSFGFDPGKFHEDLWKGKSVYVIGASKGEDSTSQIWIEKEHYNIVRMIKFENNRKEEAQFEGHIKLDGGYSETLVRFYINNKLVQVEKYHDLKANIPIDPAIFDPVNFIKYKL